MIKFVRKVVWRLKTAWKLSRYNILEEYATTAPDPKNSLSIFKNEWSSYVPLPGLPPECTGGVNLFGDDRIAWGIKTLGGVKDFKVLELGPLEGGHSSIMQEAGAASILAIEANTRCYLRCLVIKELLNLNRVHFLCGDFVEYLRSNTERYDLVLASGVLYHMRNPAELIARIARTSDRVILWTHYFDKDYAAATPAFGSRFRPGAPAEFDGFKLTHYQQFYRQALASKAFTGGNQPYSNWIGRDDLMNCLKQFGFKNIQIYGEMKGHPNGPCLTLTAQK